MLAYELTWQVSLRYPQQFNKYVIPIVFMAAQLFEINKLPLYKRSIESKLSTMFVDLVLILLVEEKITNGSVGRHYCGNYL